MCVYDYGTRLKEVNKFFFKNNVLPKIAFINYASESNTEYYNRFSAEDKQVFLSRLKDFTDEYYECKVNNKEISPYMKAYFNLKFVSLFFRRRHTDDIIPFLPYTGACFPGFKISVRHDGKFDICERVNSTMPIGNIYDGFNYDSMSKVIKEYNSMDSKECKNCPINKLCNLCYAHCMCDGEFILPESFCKNSIEYFRESLSGLFSILECRPDAFDEIEQFYSDNKTLLTLLY
jgi:uncharacterized protein